jgi:UDP-N-acetyl-D-glucosamine dehydrogenase
MNVLEKINNKQLTIGILGMGYVGLLSANKILENNENENITIYGFDIEADIITQLRDFMNNSPCNQNIYQDINLEAVWKGMRSDIFKIFHSTNIDNTGEKLSECDVILICINIKLDKQKMPDLRNLDSAVMTVENALLKRIENAQKRNAFNEKKEEYSGNPLVILESTTYPGSSQRLIENLKKRKNKNQRILTLKNTFFYCCSPQRYDFGNNIPIHKMLKDNKKSLYELSPKLLGTCYANCGNDCNIKCEECEECSVLGSAFYKEILKLEVIPEKSLECVELTKIFENVYRTVNIALANELKMICDKMKINYWEAMEAAETKSFGFTPFYSGPGVGGGCIPIDPRYLSWKAKEFNFETEFIKIAGKTNEDMHRYFINQLTTQMEEKGISIRNSKLLIVGLGYKNNTHQIVESPSVKIMKELLKKGSKVAYYDHKIAKIHKTRLLLGSDEIIISNACTSLNFYELDKNFKRSIVNGEYCKSISTENLSRVLNYVDGVLVLNDNVITGDEPTQCSYKIFKDEIYKKHNSGKLLCFDPKNIIRLGKEIDNSKDPLVRNNILDFKERIESKKNIKVSVIGLGYIGLALLMRIADMEFTVIGCDSNSDIVSNLSKQMPVSHIDDIPSESIKAVKEKHKELHKSEIIFVENIKELEDCDIFIFCIDTPIDRNKNPDIERLSEAVDNFKNNIIPKTKTAGKKPLVILESTTYPGCNRELFADDKFKNDNSSDLDFYLVHSPERINPGEKNTDISSVIKVVGGFDDESIILGYYFYKTLINCQKVQENFDPNSRKASLKNSRYKTHYETKIDVETAIKTERLKNISVYKNGKYRTVRMVSSLEVAEMTKLLENIYRSVNIALSGELLMLCNKMAINFWRVVDLAKTKPFGFEGFYPGPGYGGHCIPVDPYYLAWKAREYDVSHEFIEMAGQINDKLINFTAEQIRKLIIRVNKHAKVPKILFVGVSYKENVGDVRESTATRIIKILKKDNIEIEWFDPLVYNKLDLNTFAFYREESTPIEKIGALDKYDLIVLHTAHDERYVNYDLILGSRKPILDCRNYYDSAPKYNDIKKDNVHILGVSAN